MIHHYLKAAMLMACTLGSITEITADDPPKKIHIDSWFNANQVFVETQLRLLALPVDSPYDPEVVDYIQQYIQPGRLETEKMLGQAHYYLPIFERYLKVNDLPEALKYLPVVESGLFPKIRSVVGATGLWQFMYSTAKHMDLKIDEQIDERCDPRRSTEAAVALLIHLKKRFGDWNLALAAYNCGPRLVEQAIRKTGKAEYSAIRHLLPKQTQRYLIKYQAAAYVCGYYDFFGLKPRLSKHFAGNPVKIELKGSMKFEEIASLSGVSLETIRVLNPEYANDLVPSGSRHPRIVLPVSAAKLLLAALGLSTAMGDQEQAPNNQSIMDDGAKSHTIGAVNHDYQHPAKKPRPFAVHLRNVLWDAISGILPHPERLPEEQNFPDFYPAIVQRQGLRFSGMGC